MNAHLHTPSRFRPCRARAFAPPRVSAASRGLRDWILVLCLVAWCARPGASAAQEDEFCEVEAGVPLGSSPIVPNVGEVNAVNRRCQAHSNVITNFYELPATICRPDSTSTRARPRHEPVGDVARDALGVDASSEATRLHLSQARPNPAKGGVTLVLTVPTGATGEYVLEVFDIRGRRLLRSPRHVVEPGRYEIAWSGLEAGRPVATGIYFLRLQGPAGFREIRKVTVFR